MKTSLADLRKEYTLGGLRRRDLAADPIEQFQKWFEQAIAAGVPEPSAMTLATASRDGQPASRIVLLKSVDARGFGFYTNYASDKGRELEANPRAALVLYWSELERQVRISGTVSKVSREESQRYFESRPRGSRLGAWVSRQSTPIGSREELEAELQKVEAKYPEETVPLPPYWGGYVVAPEQLEFWQGRPNRLHDRLRYTRQPDQSWRIERLAP